METLSMTPLSARVIVISLSSHLKLCQPSALGLLEAQC